MQASIFGFYPYDDGKPSIQVQFQRFHAKHPEVYEGLVRLARQWRSRYRGPWSVDAAYHVLRFQTVMAGQPDPDEDYKLNNNYTSRYARLIMDTCPDLEGVFETRKLRS